MPFISSVRREVGQVVKIIVFKDCGVEDGEEAISKCNSIACSNVDYIVHEVEGECGVGVLLVAATDRVAGNERKGYYNSIQKVKIQDTKLDEEEVESQLVPRNVNVENRLSEHQEDKLVSLLLK
jgi:hypothetical protein